MKFIGVLIAMVSLSQQAQGFTVPMSLRTGIEVAPPNNDTTELGKTLFKKLAETYTVEWKNRYVESLKSALASFGEVEVTLDLGDPVLVPMQYPELSLPKIDGISFPRLIMMTGDKFGYYAEFAATLNVTLVNPGKRTIRKITAAAVPQPVGAWASFHAQPTNGHETVSAFSSALAEYRKVCEEWRQKTQKTYVNTAKSKVMYVMPCVDYPAVDAEREYWKQTYTEQTGQLFPPTTRRTVAHDYWKIRYGHPTPYAFVLDEN